MVHFIIVGVLVIISTYFVSQGLTNDWLLPEQASEQARIIDEVFGLHWTLISFFFSLIVVFMLYSIIVFRRKKGEEGDGVHFEGNTPLEIVWTIVPLIIVLYLAVTGAESLGKVEARTSDPLIVNVTGAQWDWSFEYVESGAVSDQLHLPVNRQVLLRLHSLDVIHSFWVPEFRVKQDVLPGGDEFIRELRITPNKEGNYTVRCAELCGMEHSGMEADVVVESESAFEGWLVEQVCPYGEFACAGLDVSIEKGCTACHSIDGTAKVGPTWVGLIGATIPLEDGSTIVGDVNYIRESILDPNAKVHEGFLADVMPKNFGEVLTDEQIDQIIALIESLQ
ncbi:MAG: cytochrome c oxidase subunit II [Anaerolineae bacterium]|nr:cytochrome c oxidase subunit II [Anaerolineae bacterium]